MPSLFLILKFQILKLQRKKTGKLFTLLMFSAGFDF